MMQPRRWKYRTTHRLRRREKGLLIAKSGYRLEFGTYGLQSLSGGLLTSQQIESARVTIARATKRGGKTWVRRFPDFPVTEHPVESRMGKGKGGVKGYAAFIRPGTVLFEMSGVAREVAKEALRLAGHKLPFKVKFVER